MRTAAADTGAGGDELHYKRELVAVFGGGGLGMALHG
jgi:hypothetical protein